eukprot:TRINITY_DN74177_c0_g1_i1.p1 TRINITY_DN74177_c0_g1~~TRINITY_DN74177_c0_g1_i1.p1  ORF type:complete len:431 (-),score=50.13 TRINITY_DN74177_c0_g1_i1:49-1341(-)
MASCYEPLNGVWEATEGITGGGHYFITEKDSRVHWLGVGRDGSWVHVFCGTRTGDMITGEFSDIPKGRRIFHGSISIQVGANKMALTAVHRGRFGTKAWQRARAGSCLDAAFFDDADSYGYWGDDYLTGIFDNDEMVNPKVQPGTYFMSQVDDRIFWFGRSNTTRQWANVGHGTVVGSEVHIDWCDIPLGDKTYAGRLVLESNILTSSLRIKHKEGLFGGNSWKKRSMPSDRLTRWISPVGFLECEGKNYSMFVRDQISESLKPLEDFGLWESFSKRSQNQGKDVALVYTYTEECPVYKQVGRTLRADSPALAPWSGYVRSLRLAIKALSKEHSFVGTVYRGFVGDASVYVVGLEFFWPAFTSTSTDAQVSQGFGDVQCTVDIQPGTLCVALQPTWTAFPNEAEVILADYTRLRVLSRNGKKVHLQTMPS